MQPLHYPAVATVADQLSPMAAASADGQICAAEGAPDGEAEHEPQASEQSIGQIDPITPGWTRRLRIGPAAPRTLWWPQSQISCPPWRRLALADRSVQRRGRLSQKHSLKLKHPSSRLARLILPLVSNLPTSITPIEYPATTSCSTHRAFPPASTTPCYT